MSWLINVDVIQISRCFTKASALDLWTVEVGIGQFLPSSPVCGRSEKADLI